ncbi:Hypothetical predicted protein [Mytilus galloprovincialis]|uniref:C-type lectin domain-containing protein n=2 Tax=Mytilus galloprovincialis TaxID=29158 RepID=A0A8B6E1P1_MYTGA|nr:Hypothetical predicted protein [Mytilus galloprovincialis]
MLIILPAFSSLNKITFMFEYSLKKGMVALTLLSVITLYLNLTDALDYTRHLCRYHYHYTAVSWASAREICERTNRTLLIIDSSIEITNISDTFMPLYVELVTPDHNPISQTLWIGLHQEINPVRLLWDTCDEYTTNNDQWSASTGNSEGCVVFNYTNQMFSIQACTNTQPFICEDTFEAVADCFDEFTASELAAEIPLDIIGSDGASDGVELPNPYEECADLCLTLGCVAFQLDPNDQKDCYRHYYDYSNGLAFKRNTNLVYLNKIFTLNDNTSSTTPLISNYYCPISSSSVRPTSSSSYNSDIKTSTLSETTHIAVYSLDPTMISTELLSSQTTTSSSGVMTTSNVVSRTSSSTCYCPCSATVASSSITTEELQAKIDKIQTELTVDKKETSSYKRRLTSAPDNRVSAQSIGYVGVVILTIVIGLLIVIDIPTLVKDTRNFFKRCCSLCKG